MPTDINHLKLPPVHVNTSQNCLFDVKKTHIRSKISAKKGFRHLKMKESREVIVFSFY